MGDHRLRQKLKVQKRENHRQMLHPEGDRKLNLFQSSRVGDALLLTSEVMNPMGIFYMYSFFMLD